jgi:hypothetical protein
MPSLPESIPNLDVNSAKVAYATETLNMIQAETFMAECAYRRSIASSLTLEIHMMRKREVLNRARKAFRLFCRRHHPHRTLRFGPPNRAPSTSFTPTSLPNLNVEGSAEPFLSLSLFAERAPLQIFQRCQLNGFASDDLYLVSLRNVVFQEEWSQ